MVLTARECMTDLYQQTACVDPGAIAHPGVNVMIGASFPVPA